MTSEKIYPIFQKKLNNDVKEIFNKESTPNKARDFNVIISFADISKREEFIRNNKNLINLRKFDFLPSIKLKLSKEKILELQSNDLIERIQEDQKLYLSMFEVIENIGLNKYRKTKGSSTGNNVIVGIIDNGINRKFDTFKGVRIKKYFLTKKTTENEITHGTLMANIIANQYLDNNNNYIGIAPNVKIIDFDISNPEEKYYFSNILEMFDIIIKDYVEVDILLISFTTFHPSDGQDILSLACNSLVDKGIAIVSPAGNFGPENYTIGSPSAAERVITIGSHTKENKISYFSGRGPTLDEREKPDFCLPGSKIEIPLSEDKRLTLSGTSVSAAICVGIVALIKSINPNISSNRIYAIMKSVSISLDFENISQGSGTLYVPDIFKEVGNKKIDLKEVKSKQEKFKKTDSSKERVELPSYNRMMLKSFSIVLQYILILIAIFYFFYYFETIFNYFSRLFSGGG